MSDNEDTSSQKAALLDENESAQRPQRVGLLRKLFKRKRNESTNDDPKEIENASLLGSCPELDHSGERDTIIDHRVSLPIRLQPINATDSENEDIEEEEEGGGGGDDGDDEGEAACSAQNIQHSEAHSNSDHADSSSDYESEIDTISSNENESDNEGGDEFSSKALDFQDRPVSVADGGYSLGPGYSDDPNGKAYIGGSTKSIGGRIHGFGNTVQDSEMVSPRTLRTRLKNYRENRMQKMEIGEKSIGRRSWKSNIHNAVIGIVEKVLPEDSDETFKPRQKRGVDDAPSCPLPDSGCLIAASVYPTLSQQRNKLGNDEAYIIFLEGALKKKDFELESWRVRVKELEKEVRRLKKAQNESDDSSQDSSSTHENQETGGSEIEWQTGLEPKEGILINLRSEGNAERKTHDAVEAQEKTHDSSTSTKGPGSGNDCSIAAGPFGSDASNENDVEVKEGILIEIPGGGARNLSSPRCDIESLTCCHRASDENLIELSLVGTTNPTDEDILGLTTTDSVHPVITDDEADSDDPSRSSEQKMTRNDHEKDEVGALIDVEATTNQ